jgi:hypothetical protein
MFMDELTKKWKAKDDGHLRPKRTQKIDEFADGPLKEFLSTGYSQSQAKQLVSAFVGACVLERRPVAIFSQRTGQDLIDNDPNIERKFNLRNNGSAAWKGFTVELVEELGIAKILVPSSKNGRTPAVIEFTYGRLLDVMGFPTDEMRQECLDAAKRPRDKGSKESKPQSCEGTKPQGFNGTMDQGAKESMAQGSKDSTPQGTKDSRFQAEEETKAAHQRARPQTDERGPYTKEHLLSDISIISRTSRDIGSILDWIETHYKKVRGPLPRAEEVTDVVLSAPRGSCIGLSKSDGEFLTIELNELFSGGVG